MTNGLYLELVPAPAGFVSPYLAFFVEYTSEGRRVLSSVFPTTYEAAAAKADNNFATIVVKDA